MKFTEPAEARAARAFPFHENTNSQQDYHSDSVKTCPQYSRALQSPPSSSVYFHKDGKARNYESRRWQEFLEVAKRERLCIGCVTLRIQERCLRSYFNFTDAWTRYLDDALDITKLTVLTTGAAHFWRMSVTLRVIRWLEDLHTKYAVDCFLCIASCTRRTWVKFGKFQILSTKLTRSVARSLSSTLSPRLGALFVSRRGEEVP